MEILLISYGDIDFDGRLRSLINVFSRIGNVHSFTRGSESANEISKVCNVSYAKFIVEAIQFANGISKIDWMVLDNRKACIPGMIIQRRYHPTLTIQDCRELYLIREVDYLTGKLGCVFEKKMIKKADIVICANKERARIMQKEYKLINEPITYENLRQLHYESAEHLDAAMKRLDKYLHEGEYRIISSSGCSLKRTNDVLVKNLPKVRKKCRLFLVGDNTKEEEKAIKQIIKSQHLSNVEILGRLNQTELKYLISKSHIGIVNYGQYDTNNRLCASGKMYEFLYEGIPVVTTTNPPLKRLCRIAEIGVADDDYVNGINAILDEYELYKNKVDLYIKEHTIEKNDLELITELKQYKS